MLHPKQFQVNEAWIAFQMNDRPLPTTQDGPVDIIALMDAASCFILGSATVLAESGGPSEQESRRLLEQGQAHKDQLPLTLFVPNAQPIPPLEAVAESLGIETVRISENQLLPVIGEAKQGFKERFG